MFSVRVPRGAIESIGPAVVSRYRRFLTASILLSLTVVLAKPRFLSNWSGAVAFAIEYGGFAFALFRARREVWAHASAATTQREADLSAVIEPPLSLIVAFAIPLLCIGSVAVWTYSNWNALPDPFPIHWTMGLEPDAWVPRTPLHVYGLLGLLTGATALIAILCWGLLFWSRRQRPGRADSATTLAIVIMLCAEYALAATAMLPLGFSARGTDLAIFIATAAASICLIITGRGGVSDEAGDLARMASDPSPDSAWKLGLFYFNPGDAALFVEKRFGIGWTVNLGRPWAWVLGLVVLVPMALGVAFLVAMQR